MTTDDTVVRDGLLEHVSREPPLTTDLGTVLAAGRRARARRQVLTAVAACSGLLAAVSGGLLLGQTDEGLPAPQPPPVAATPSPSRPAPAAVAALLESRVRAALPGGSALVRHQVYPSDWNRSTALPAAQAANATDWHGRFTVPGKPGNEVWIGVFVGPPRSNPTLAALRKDCGRVIPGCRVDQLRDGSLLLTQITGNGRGRWTRTLLHYRAGDRAVNAREVVTAPTYAAAVAKWVYSPAQLAVLAKDPRLVIPKPVQQPPLPKR